MKVQQEIEVLMHVFLTLVLDGDPSPSQFTSKEKMPNTCCKGDWVEPTVWTLWRGQKSLAPADPPS